MNTILSLLLLFALAAVVVADLPVHCLYPTTKGDWDFELTAQDKDKTIVNTCTLRADITSQIVKTVRISLGVPNVATDQNGNKGTWTLIYDQGFEVIIGGNKYFAFFNYTNANSQVVSHCDRTFVGTFHEEGVSAKKWGCYRAKKVNSDESYIHKYEIPPPTNGIFVNDMDTIQRINSAQNLWTAAPYPQFENMPREELFRKSGGVVPTFKVHAKNAHMSQMRQYAPLKSTTNLPTAFDWRNVDGKSYVSPVRNQASCGSCYVFGALGMLEARMKVATKDAKSPIFAPQEVVSCSTYSQGCAGGFPYLIEKYAEDFGIVEESCYPYQGRDSSCHSTSCPRQFFTNYRYIGGYYGASTEAGMMEEIYKNGPIVVNFEVLSDFYYYRSGIYKHVPKASNDPEPFVTVNHSVLIVGWGEQNGTKYWITKNSWGSGWGMNGYFLIVRGIDNVGIESLTSSATPVL